MAVRIRLSRVGGAKNPIYRIVVADSAAPRDGRSIETIGQYDPQKTPSLIEIDTEKAAAWLGALAQPSNTVRRLLALKGIKA
jgi:small subunit ribosomal protein S16